MATAAPAARADRKLQLKEVMGWLVADGLVDQDAADKILGDSRFSKVARHPLALIAESRLRSKVAPHPLLGVDALTEWLARRVSMEFYHIDPLKIDLKSVTQVMSSD